MLLAIAHRTRQRVLDEQEIVAGLHRLADQQKDPNLQREIHEQAASFETLAIDPHVALAEYLERLAREAKVR